MKAVRISLGMLAFVGIVACKSSEHAAKQVEWADKACACKDIECLTEIEKEQDAWIAEHGATAEMSGADKEKLEEASARMSDCIAAVLMGDPAGG